MRILLLIAVQFFSISIFASSGSTTWYVDNPTDTGGVYGTASTLNGPNNGDLRFCLTNAALGDYVFFALTTSPYVITLTRDITVTSALIIDGSTQPGHSPGSAPVISISGSSGYGITFLSYFGPTYISSIHFNNVRGTAITVDGSSGNSGLTSIDDCYIGTDITGNNYSGTLPPDTGIYVINGASVSIGQTTPNVILAPSAIILNSASSYSYIYNNNIGLNRNGINPSGTPQRPLKKGIELVTGSGSISSNLIGNCDSAAIVVSGSDSKVVNSNTIGKGSNGVAAPNGRGVWVKGSNTNVSDNTIANSAVISGSSGFGVEVTGSSAVNNDIYSNYYSCNKSGGITYNGGSPALTPPVFNPSSFVVYPDGTSIISGGGAAFANLEITCFLMDTLCSFQAQGLSFAGSATADGAGNWTINANGLVYKAGTKITAIARDPSNTSSVFSGGVDLVPFNCKTGVKAITGSSNITNCDTNPVYLYGSVVNATDGNWITSGTGTFSPDNNMNANSVNYTPSAADVAAGGVKLTLVTSGAFGGCPDTSSSFTISLPIPASKIYDGTTFVHACPSAAIPLDANVYNTSGGVWSTSGLGTFSPNNNTTNATYIPTAAELTSGTITITLTPNVSGACAPLPQTIQMVFDNSDPTVTIGGGKVANLIQCSSNPFILLDDTASTGQSVVKTWLKNGSPIKDTMPYINFGNTAKYYAPTAAEISNGVTLIFQGASPGCKIAKDTLSVSYVFDPTSVFAGDTLTYCTTVSSFVLNDAAVSSTSPYDISWQGEDNDGLIFGQYSDATILHPVFTPSSFAKTNTNTLYLTLEAREQTGTCPGVNDDVVILFVQPSVTYAGNDTTVCQGADIPLLNGSVNGSYPHKWVTGGSGKFTPSDTTLNATYIPSQGDFKKVAFNLSLTASNKGCTSHDELLIILVPKPDVGVGSSQVVCPANTATLNAAPTGLDQIGVWSTKLGTDSILNRTSNNTDVVVLEENNAYIWTITDTATHCSNSAEYKVNHCYFPPLKVFNALSPNNDGVGEFLEIENIGFYANNKVSIFNQWGEIVFKMDQYANNTLDGSGNAFVGKSNVGIIQELPNGSYFYLIDKNEDGQKSEKGFLVIQK